MKVAVIADSHDRLPALRRALAMFREMNVGAVLHAGDFVAPFAAKLLVGPEAPRAPLHCCYGNNDGEREGLKKVLPQVVDGPVRIELGRRTIVMHHWIEWFKPQELRGADIVISGHTHDIVNEMRDGVLYLNPGECCGWLYGRCTVALLDTDSRTAQIVELPA
jgi:uncharacterized protein